MKSSILFFVAISSLTALGNAQTPAETQVIVPCTQPAPAGSLVAQPTLPITFVDSNNVVVMEMESKDPIGNWVEESILSGFAGESYFRWDGPNLFSTPNTDTLTFRFEISTPTTYIIRQHVRHDDSDPSMENDCWVRLDGGTWEKLFHNAGPSGVGVWSFDTRYGSTDDYPKHFLAPGVHTWEVAGRSNNFKIDRIHVLPLSVFSAKLSDPESDVLRDRPVIGNQMTVEIDDPTGSSGMQPGGSLTALFFGQIGTGYPCGLPTPFGELLITGASGAIRVGTYKLWQGPGQPNVHNMPIPFEPSFVGFSFITQSVFLQPGRVVFGEGLEMTIGNI